MFYVLDSNENDKVETGEWCMGRFRRQTANCMPKREILYFVNIDGFMTVYLLPITMHACSYFVVTSYMHCFSPSLYKR